MAKFKLTNKAVEDLTKIWDYTFDKWSESKQTNIMKCCLKTANTLQMTPLLEENTQKLKMNFGD